MEDARSNLRLAGGAEPASMEVAFSIPNVLLETWPRLSGEVLMALSWISSLLGHRPGKRTLKASDFADRFDRDPSAARQWLRRAEKEGLARVNNLGRGEWSIEITDWEALAQEVKKARAEERRRLAVIAAGPQQSLRLDDERPQLGLADTSEDSSIKSPETSSTNSPEDAPLSETSSIKSPEDAPLSRGSIKPIWQMSEAEKAEALEVTRRARESMAIGAPVATHARTGKTGNVSIKGTGKWEREGEEPCNVPTRETSAPPPVTTAQPLAADYEKAIAQIPEASDTATRRRELAIEFERALGVGDFAWPAFFANVAAVVDGARGPDGAQLTREKVFAIIKRAKRNQPGDPQKRAQYASRAITGEAEKLKIPWPCAP